MKALIVSLESFQKGEIPPEVAKYIDSCEKEPFIILDESSKIKTNNPCKESKKSKRTQAILKLNRIGHRCILTGTFTSKTPVNAYDQMNFLCHKFFPESMYAFAEHYEIRRNLNTGRGTRITLTQDDYMRIRKRLVSCGDNKAKLFGTMEGVHSYYGLTGEDCRHILAHEDYTPFKNMDDLWGRIGDTCLKVDRKDLFDLPPKVYRSFNVELTPEQKKLYLQLQNQYCTDHITVDNGLKLYLRFQDVCNGYDPVDHGDTVDENGNVKHNIELVPLKENPKLDALEEILEEIGDRQVVVWCSRSKLLYDAEARVKSLGYTTGIYDGKIGKEEREESYRAFQAKELNVLFVNQASGAYGLDGLKEADYAVYLCNSYSVEQREQSEDRIYRGQVKTSKHIIDITFRGTCEDRVTEALKQGKELLDLGTTDASIFLLSE